MKQELKPNILFLVVDSLRIDRIDNASKTVKIPNIESLINSGVLFNHVIGCSDTTILNIGSLFSSQYPFKNGLDVYRNHSKTTYFFDKLKNHNYFRYATVPNLSFFRSLTKNFEKTNFTEIMPTQLLDDEVGEKIIQQLNQSQTPWINYVHLLDLHPTKNIFHLPSKFNSKEYGNTKYDRTVSLIDDWIGKIIKHVDLEKTLVIVTSDHGEYVSEHKNLVYDAENLESFFRNLKKYFPFLESIGIKLFLTIRKILFSIRRRKLKKSLSELEMRSLKTRLEWDLYDEIIRVPLIFSGYGIKNIGIIDKQICQMDIVPTLLEIIGLPIDSNIDGQSLMPILTGSSFNEIPIYIESATNDPKSLGNVIGIRTPEYKMYKSRYPDKKRVLQLFDLKKDPLEETNIANEELQVISDLEKLISQIKHSKSSSEKDSIKRKIMKKKKFLSLKE